MQEAHAKSPDDYRILLELDYVLSMRGQHDPIVALWTDYLSRHTSDGRVYFERAGAYHHRGMETEARADAMKACELGINEACLHASEG